MAHIHEKIDFTVEAFIVHDNKVLLRKHDKYKIWLSVGGHVELDEDPNQAMLREVREEVGLEVELFDSRVKENSDGDFIELIPPVALARHAASIGANPDHVHVVMVYFAVASSDDVRVDHEGDRSDEWRWFSKEDLEEIDVRPNIKEFALRALAALAS
jgi:8-oxo-dGTP diphosphatase